MTFGNDQKNKAFVNKSIKGRGYVDDGSSVPREFYAPFVPRKYDFIAELKKIPSMKVLDTKEVYPTLNEIEEAYEEFGIDNNKS